MENYSKVPKKLYEQRLKGISYLLNMPESCDSCFVHKNCHKEGKVHNAIGGLECSSIWAKRKEKYNFIKKAMEILKTGDRLRVTKCPGTKRTITFDCFDGPWMVSKSGIDDYWPGTIDKINGVLFSFKG